MKFQKTLFVAVAVFVLALTSWVAYALVLDQPSTITSNSGSMQLTTEKSDVSPNKNHDQNKLPCGSGMTGDHTGSVFDGVQKVNIIVAFSSNRFKSAEGQETLPKPLQKKNIEKLYREVYEERFTELSRLKKFKGYYPTKSKNCYNRNNQPVEILKTDLNSFFNEEYNSELHQEDVLTVIVRVRVLKGEHHRPSINHDTIAVSTLNYRNYDKLNILDRSVFNNPATFISSSSDEQILQTLRSYIFNNII